MNMIVDCASTRKGHRTYVSVCVFSPYDTQEKYVYFMCCYTENDADFTGENIVGVIPL